MTSPSETAVDHQMAADEEDMLDPMPVPAGPPLTEDPQPAAPVMAWHWDAIAMPGPAEEPEAVSQDEPEQPVIHSVPDAEPEPVRDSPAASAPAASATDGVSTRWRETQAMFVDDPLSSAESAAALVDDSVQALLAFVREQQGSLLAAWHDEDPGTEELRTAVQHYRAFDTRLADFCRQV
jgi:hypothetical protein